MVFVSSGPPSSCPPKGRMDEISKKMSQKFKLKRKIVNHLIFRILVHYHIGLYWKIKYGKCTQSKCKHNKEKIWIYEYKNRDCCSNVNIFSYAFVDGKFNMKKWNEVNDIFYNAAFDEYKVFPKLVQLKRKPNGKCKIILPRQYKDVKILCQ